MISKCFRFPIIFFILLSLIIPNCSTFSSEIACKILRQQKSWHNSITKGTKYIKSAMNRKIELAKCIYSAGCEQLENVLLDRVCQPVGKVVYPVYDTITFKNFSKANFINPFKKLNPFSLLAKGNNILRTFKNLQFLNKGIRSYLTNPFKRLNFNNPLSGFIGYFKNFFGDLSSSPVKKVKKFVGHILPSSLESFITHPLEHFNLKNPFAKYSKNFFEHLSLNPVKNIKGMASHLMPSNFRTPDFITHPLEHLKLKNPFTGYYNKYFGSFSLSPVKNAERLLSYLEPSWSKNWGLDTVTSAIKLVYFSAGIIAAFMAIVFYRCIKHLAGEYDMFDEFYNAHDNYIDDIEEKVQELPAISSSQLQDPRPTPSSVADIIKPKEKEEADLIEEDLPFRDSLPPPPSVSDIFKPEEKDPVDEPDATKDTKTSATQTDPIDAKGTSTQTDHITSKSSDTQTDKKESEDHDVQTDDPPKVRSSSSRRTNTLHPPAISPNI